MIPRIIKFQNLLKLRPFFYLKSIRNFTSAANDDKSKPIKYTTSKAFKYKASESFRVPDEPETVPPYNSFVIKASVVIFLIYFCYLRESNDIDDLLSRDLFEIVPDLEIPMLEVDIQRLEKRGMNVDDLKIKLVELKRLDAEKKQKSNQEIEPIKKN